MKILLTTAACATMLCAAQIASAAPIIIGAANLTGSQETPPTGSPATGSVLLTLNGDILTVALTFSGLTGGPAAAGHIHCCTPPGTNIGVTLPFTGFPAVTAGTYTNNFDLSTTAVYTSAFVTANGGTGASAEAAFLAGIAAGRSYANIHNATFPGGEIRGFITPEPATALLIAPALAALLLKRRARA